MCIRDSTDTDAQNNNPARPAATNDQFGAVEEDIAKAECLEDLDDVTAETLFGADITELAAHAIGGND